MKHIISFFKTILLGTLVNIPFFYVLIMNNIEWSYIHSFCLGFWLYLVGALGREVISGAKRKGAKEALHEVFEDKQELSEDFEMMKLFISKLLKQVGEHPKDSSHEDKIYIALVHLLMRAHDKRSPYLEAIYQIATKKELLSILDTKTSEELEKEREKIKQSKPAEPHTEGGSEGGIAF